MAFVFKHYSSEHCETNIHFPESHRVFAIELTSHVFEIFKLSQRDWRSMKDCLCFVERCLTLLPSDTVRDKYLDFLVTHFVEFNQAIKLKIIDIFIAILMKLHDNSCKLKIHIFVNEELAKAKSVYDRKLFIVFCSRISSLISKRYFKDVFAFTFLKLIDERRKDIAITLAMHVVSIRRKLDDVTSTSKIESTLNTLKSVFHKDKYVHGLCSEAYNLITSAQFKAELKSNHEI